MRARTGFTLLETLIAVVMVSLLMMIAFPKVRTAIVKNDLRSARSAVINATARARAAATEGSRFTWLVLDGNRAVVVASPRRVDLPGSSFDTIGVVLDLDDSYGVAVGGGAPDSIRFTPSGFGADLAGTKTISLWRSSHSETITLDGMGRVTK